MPPLPSLGLDLGRRSLVTPNACLEIYPIPLEQVLPGYEHAEGLVMLHLIQIQSDEVPPVQNEDHPWIPPVSFFQVPHHCSNVRY